MTYTDELRDKIMALNERNLTIVWHDTTLTVQFGTYPANGNTWIQLFEDGMPYAKATVNPNLKMFPQTVAIKTIDENKGLLEALEAAKIVTWIGESTPCGFYDAYLCQINLKAEPVKVEVKAEAEEPHTCDDLTTLSAHDLQTVINWLSRRIGTALAGAEDTASIYSFEAGEYSGDELAEVVGSGLAQGRVDELDETITAAQSALKAKK